MVAGFPRHQIGSIAIEPVTNPHQIAERLAKDADQILSNCDRKVVSVKQRRPDFGIVAEALCQLSKSALRNIGAVIANQDETSRLAAEFSERRRNPGRYRRTSGNR